MLVHSFLMPRPARMTRIKVRDLVCDVYQMHPENQNHQNPDTRPAPRPDPRTREPADQRQNPENPRTRPRDPAPETPKTSQPLTPSKMPLKCPSEPF